MAPGVDITARWKDIQRLAMAYYRAPKTQEYLRASAAAGHAGRRMEAEDFVQEVALAIHRKNGTSGAYDPARGTLGTYVWRVCFSVASHGTERLDGETLLPDPARIGAVPAQSAGIPAGVREALESHGPALAAMAKERLAARRRGQLHLFTPEEEAPVLAAVA